jgi:hypothetical protein
VLSLGAKPRELKLGNNILILSPKDMCNFMFILGFWQGENMQGRCVLVERMQFHG